jgi:pimeloyl-ACP methyl ester carboxylesterase
METLFLIPPMGHNHSFFNELVAQLNDKFEIVFLNYPRLAADFDSSGDILEDFARYFAKKILEKEVLSASILGLSLGATLSLRIKELLPDKIDTLFMMASGGLKVARARKSMINYALEKIPPHDFIKKALGLSNIDEFIIHFSRNHDIASEYYLDMLDEQWKDENLEKYSGYFIDQIKAALEVNYEAQMQSFQEDIVFIWGESDKIFSLRHYKKFIKLMPKACFHLLGDLGHYLPLESPKQTAKIILNYEKS